ncbi:MAG: hypothetical protein ACRETX_15465, partial [Steroidobacteraceae bacterium]
GKTVCCVNECLLEVDCPGGTPYLPCMQGSDCARWGGAKVCCQMGTMRFCTKPNGCNGQVIP